VYLEMSERNDCLNIFEGSIRLSAIPFIPSLLMDDQAFQVMAHICEKARMFPSLGTSMMCSCCHTWKTTESHMTQLQLGQQSRADPP
jgi:hypothetical protein